MDEVTQQAPAQNTRISKEERSKIMSEAAKLRWAKARKAKALAEKLKTAPKAAPAKKKATAPREFSSALRTAEKRLAMAILERSKAAATYAVLSAEIPSLQRLIVALRNPLGVAPEYGAIQPATLEQIVGDQPIAYPNPPRVMPTAALPPAPEFSIPQALHPANTVQQNRGGGGAIDVPLDADASGEDEDQFLRESAIAGGQWH
jgi:hypothetical protein